MKRLFDKNNIEGPMDFFKRRAWFFSFLVIVCGIGSILPVDLYAAGSNDTQQKLAVTQRLFESPDEAIKALQAAASVQDKVALNDIFGAQFQELLIGDEVQDTNNAKRFAVAMSQVCVPVKEGEDKIIFEVGSNNWPMPIPLVKANGQWYFDTADGKEEIISRHIGKNELHAIGVCRAYVIAQQQYAGMNPQISGGTEYAQKFKSASGKKDGLYWQSDENEPVSPFGPLVAKAHAEGYGGNKGAGPHPFHGYYFRILTRQGKDAPGGKKDYMSRGNLMKGFALVAYPEKWDKSGIMTFIVNQEGKVFQRNLGEKTLRIAGAMKEYNPGSEWTLVQDEGVLNAAAEK
jgi:hypothetical protein